MIEKSCWWQEGGRCYIEDVKRLPNGRSTKMCEGKCDEYKNKRSVLSKGIPDDKLVIVSELNTK